MLTAQRLRALLDYDAETGDFSWKVPKARCVIIDRRAASAVNSDGYRHIKIDNRSHKAHRLAWLHVYGEWPPHQIDHIDGDRSNNRIANLRSVTPNENRRNLKLYVSNTSGIKGVFWNKASRKWQVQISVNKKKYHLGFFAEISDAAAAYDRAAEEMHGAFRRGVS